MSIHAANGPQARTVYAALTANHVVLVLMAIIAVGYFSTLHELHLKWTLFDQFYSHGYLLLAFAVYLGFGLRRRLAAMTLAPLPVMLLPLGGAVMVWALARIVDVQIVQFLLLPVLLLLASAATLGFAATRLIAGPVCLIYFAIPLWDYAIPLLQSITVAVCGVLIDALGIPASIKGHYIEIPAGIFHVENGCSGVNYMVVMLSLAYSYAWMEHLRGRQWLTLMALALLAGLAANWVRVGSLVVIGYHTQMQHRLVHDHVNYGWMIFVGAMVLLALVARFLIVPATPSAPQVKTVAAHKRTASQSLFLFFVLIVLLAGPALALLATSQLAGSMAPAAIALAPGSVKGGWVISQPEATPGWSPDFKHADDIVIRKLSNGFDEWTLQIFRYHNQSHGKELISYDNHLYAEDAWELLGSGVAIEGLRYIDIRSKAGGARFRVWYWYEVAGSATTSTLGAKLYSALGLFKRRSDASLATLSRTCPGQCSALKMDEQTLRDLVAMVRREL